MAKQLLHGANVAAIMQQLRGGMCGLKRAYTGLPKHCLPDGFLYNGDIQMMAFCAL